MKWRKVAQIPWGKPAGNLPENMIYEAVPSVMEIDGVSYLVIDFFDCSREEQEGGAFAPAQMERKEAAESAAVPFLRAAYTKDDYGMFWTKEGEKAGSRLTDEYGQLKQTTEPMFGKPLRKHTFMTPEGEDSVFLYAEGKPKDAMPWKRSWETAVRDLENNSAYKRRSRKEKRDTEKMLQRHADTPLPPEAFTRYLEHMLDSIGYLFYRKKNGKGTVRCSRCGEEYGIRYRRSEGIAALAQHVSEEPADNCAGTCEMCGGHGIYKPVGRMQNEYHVQQDCFLIQPFRDTGIVIREYVTEKVMYTEGPEELVTGERGRAYFYRDRVQIDWCVYYPGENGYWQYRNGGGMNPWRMGKGPVWPGSWPLIEETDYGHSGLREYLWHCEHTPGERAGGLSAEAYMRLYMTRRCVEMAVKAGLWDIVKALGQGHTDILPHPKARKPWEKLGIWPERMEMLRAEEGDRRLLRILQKEREAQCRLTENQIRMLLELGMGADSLDRIRRYMGIQRFMNRIEKYAGVEILYTCSHGLAHVRHIAQVYLDYLDMQAAVGADMADQIIQHPRNLQEEHDKMVTAANEEKNRKLCEEKEAQYPKIRKAYARLLRRYGHTDGFLSIRPAKSASEIIREGQTLHHCVGGDNYLGRHNEGKSYILLLRWTDHEREPYVTVEIEPRSFTVVQWYGVQDTKPDKEAVQEWLDKYTGILREYGDMDAYLTAAQEAQAGRMLMAAV